MHTHTERNVAVVDGWPPGYTLGLSHPSFFLPQPCVASIFDFLTYSLTISLTLLVVIVDISSEGVQQKGRKFSKVSCVEWSLQLIFWDLRISVRIAAVRDFKTLKFVWAILHPRLKIRWACKSSAFTMEIPCILWQRRICEPAKGNTHQYARENISETVRFHVLAGLRGQDWRTNRPNMDWSSVFLGGTLRLHYPAGPIQDSHRVWSARYNMYIYLHIYEHIYMYMYMCISRSRIAGIYVYVYVYSSYIQACISVCISADRKFHSWGNLVFTDCLSCTANSFVRVQMFASMHWHIDMPSPLLVLLNASARLSVALSRHVWWLGCSPTAARNGEYLYIYAYVYVYQYMYIWWVSIHICICIRIRMSVHMVSVYAYTHK